MKPYCSSSVPSTVKEQTFARIGAMKTLDEADVGIVCYISELPGFRGVLKQRYSENIINIYKRDVQLYLYVPPACVFSFSLHLVI